MQPVMVEQHIIRLAEIGAFKAIEAALWEEFEDVGGGYKTRQKRMVLDSKVIKLLATVKQGKRIFILFSGGHLICLVGGDQIELNGTEQGHGTGLCFVLNSLPDIQPLRRINTSFRSVDKIYPDMTTV